MQEASGCRCEDLFKDLRDGHLLRTLLQNISGESLPRLQRGTSRLHCVGNVGVSLDYLRRRVRGRGEGGVGREVGWREVE